MDRVTAGMATVDSLSVVAEKVAGKLPADSYLAEMVVGVVGKVADRHRVAYLLGANSLHTVHGPYPGWGIGFVEWDHSVPGLDTDS